MFFAGARRRKMRVWQRIKALFRKKRSDETISVQVPDEKVIRQWENLIKGFFRKGELAYTRLSPRFGKDDVKNFVLKMGWKKEILPNLLTWLKRYKIALTYRDGKRDLFEIINVTLSGNWAYLELQPDQSRARVNGDFRKSVSMIELISETGKTVFGCSL